MRSPDSSDGGYLDDLAFIEREVAVIVNEVTGRPIQDAKTPLVEHGADSMTLLEILTYLEKKFSIVLYEELIKDFASVYRIALLVQHAMHDQKGPPKARFTPLD